MLCIYVSIYVCMHVFICVCMYVCTSRRKYIHKPNSTTTTNDNKKQGKNNNKKRPGVPTSTGSPCGGGSHATAVHNLRRGRRFFLGRFHFLAHVCVCLEACMSVECVFIMRYRFLGWFLVYARNARDFVLRFFFSKMELCVCMRACVPAHSCPFMFLEIRLPRRRSKQRQSLLVSLACTPKRQESS